MAHIKASFRNITDESKSQFSSQDCLLTISVGQGYHEGEIFEATVNLIASSFRSCTIILYDSLQRYTMALSENKLPDIFHKSAVLEGDLWLERNEKYFNAIQMMKLPVQRWDQWLEHQNYASQRQKIGDALRNDVHYRLAFEETINEYLTKYVSRDKNNVKDMNDARAKELCLTYLIEECTVLCLWVETNAHYEAYPAARNKAMAATYERFIQPKFPSLLRSLGFKFRNHPQLMPQQFLTLDRFKEQTKI